MAKHTLSDVQLRNFSKYIIHDLRMLQQTVARVNGEINICSNNIVSVYVSNALMESALIHARVLIDFLYPSKKPKNDDVTINDFLGEKRNFEISPKSSLLDECKYRVGKEIAHLTYTRIKYKKWKFGDIANQLSKRMQEFYVQCEPNKLGTEFKDFFENGTR